MQHKLFAPLIALVAVFSIFAESGSRSPYEALNCLEAGDHLGFVETLKYVSVNSRFTPQGNTILMAAIDMYAQRLASRSPIELSVGRAVGGVAALVGCIATYALPQAHKPIIKFANSGSSSAAEQPPNHPPLHEQSDARPKGWWHRAKNKIPFHEQADKLADTLNSVAHDVNHIKYEACKTFENWNDGGIPISVSGSVAEATAQKIIDAAAEAEASFRLVRSSIRSAIFISCASIATYLGITLAKQYLLMQRATERYEKDIEMYEAVIDELLIRQEIDFTVKNNAGETVIDLIRRLIMLNAADNEILTQLLKVERKILHAARGVYHS